MAAPSVHMIVAWVGALTALFAALMGFAQYDIKKVLAYSTVSQLGFMFLACGVGAFTAGFFHLLTHAFFKALMFLGSGSVIHGMHHEQDMRKMGGLRKYMPLTHLTFLIGWLSIIGVPPFSGFFSKDEILWMAFGSQQSHTVIWGIAVVAACCTAFYMTRLMCLTFWGQERFDSEHGPHESPLVMTIPLMILAGLAFIGGWMGVPHALGEWLPGHPGHWLEGWFDGIVAQPKHLYKERHDLELALMSLSTGLSVVFAFLAILFYTRLQFIREKIKTTFPKLYDFVANKFYVDEFYEAVFVRPFHSLSEGVWAHFDVGFIDQSVETAATTSKSFGRWGVLFQTGNLQFYLMVIFFGLVFLTGLVLL